MKKILVAAMLCVAFGNAYPVLNEFNTDKKKGKKENKKEEDKLSAGNNLTSRNFHSIKKWKMTIVYNSGEVISKTITINKNASTSTMDAAFEEAEKYVKTLKKVREYRVSPVSGSSIILLAGN
ncbi:hypothetical protein GCM10022393_38850 [Aquimarina addita]|uniref:TonB C-terminal domain-containing protein n=1 Tax=Aquimarina addita TaxID=870485 RepID=A0ABP6UU56_9FLAO